MLVENAVGNDRLDEFLLLIVKLRLSDQGSIRIAWHITPLFLGTSTKRGSFCTPLAWDSAKP
jgi:hypothetical protein